MVGDRCAEAGARRLVERGVRFAQVYSGGNYIDTTWDAHDDLVYNHTLHASATDRPIADLLSDLEQRGLLNDTLIVWRGRCGADSAALGVARRLGSAPQER